MKKIFKWVIILFIIFIIGLRFWFVYVSSQKPEVSFVEDMTAEINTDRMILDYLDKTDGKVVSEDRALDTSSLGVKVIKISVQNKYKKEFEYKYKVTVKDTTAPTIVFNPDLSTVEGEEIDLLNGVTAGDNSNEDIKVDITGEYDFNKPGEYLLNYEASDSSGNKTVEGFKLVVKEKPKTVAVPVNDFPTNDKAVEPGYPYYIRLNRQMNVVYVYAAENGMYSNLVQSFTCSTGAQTPLGVYRTSDKYVWRLLVGDVWGQYSTRITGHILFHSVPYLSQTKDSLEYWEYNLLGIKRSLGCVRLTVRDAKWLYDNCPSGTRVEIYDSSSLEGPNPSAPKIDTNDSRRGWDPTDPDPSNPWNS